MLQEKNLISVWNNGRGVPVEIHKEEKVYIPELIFGHLLTSSNYDDTQKKVVKFLHKTKAAAICTVESSQTACPEGTPAGDLTSSTGRLKMG